MALKKNVKMPYSRHSGYKVTLALSVGLQVIAP